MVRLNFLIAATTHPVFQFSEMVLTFHVQMVVVDLDEIKVSGLKAQVDYGFHCRRHT
ncbi:hypothetical protein DPMN_009040 [Dreissena polymorpha]|uniref:Uncharacterized protein n=1 Tax=Dreissena polymorpha TaxID=45954 RepID=A0A9D4MW79_DREPO|nr:hypothetical protein DPMN_009040 [Dreissena polymorpha]